MKLKMLVAVIAFGVLAVSSVCSAHAGDLSLYSKFGVMDWQERADGKQFVRETGPTQEIGVNHIFNYDGVDFNQSIGLWSALLAYDGSDLATNKPLKMFSHDIGLKGNLGVSVPIRISDIITLSPLGDINSNIFYRAAGPEKWVIIAARTGLSAKFNDKYEVKAGVLYPFYTTVNCDWTASGAKSAVTTKPKGRITPFAEANLKINEHWQAGAYFEVWKWAASDGAPFQYSGNNPNSLLAKFSYEYQPDTTVFNSGVSLEYRF